MELLKTKYNPQTLSFITNNNQSLKINTIPKGWKKVASQSRPGEFSYENIYTEERIPDIPKFEASKIENKSEDLKFYD